MTEAEKSLPLAADFPRATRDEWRRLVDGALKGTPFGRLTSTTYDGLTIAALSARWPDARPIAARAGAAPWQVMARIDHTDPALANRAARQELENGATGLSLVFAGAVGDYGFGLPRRGDEIDRVLDGIETAGIALEVDSPAPFDALVTAPPGAGPLRAARIGQDPLGIMAVSGTAPRRWSDLAPRFGARLGAMSSRGYRGRIAAADGRVIHNAGGSEAQELAFVLAVALAYLRTTESAGLPLEEARRMVFFRLAADADQFLTIAKFRALRKLWARIESACGLTAEPAFVSAETAWRMMTQRDAQTNILRTTIAAFGAALGGADAISVLPFTAALGLPDDFARRIARNSQLVLLEEVSLAKVADPGAGSGTVEDLTDQLCRAAWMQLQEIETAGGAGAVLESGLIQRHVATVRAQRASAVARLKDALTGASIFPYLREEPAGHTHSPPLRGRSTAKATGEGSPEGNPLAANTHLPNSPPQGESERFLFAPLPPIRLAQPFEALRDASDRRLAATGARPKILLACLGTPADFTPRATFAKNFFEAGGIEAVSREGDASTLGAAFTASGAALACLCASDKISESEAAAAATALKAAGARHIYLAGRPGGREAAWRAAGAMTLIDEGCDALAVLEDAHALIASGS